MSELAWKISRCSFLVLPFERAGQIYRDETRMRFTSRDLYYMGMGQMACLQIERLAAHTDHALLRCSNRCLIEP
jgi:hypothetical protein